MSFTAAILWRDVATVVGVAGVVGVGLVSLATVNNNEQTFATIYPRRKTLSRTRRHDYRERCHADRCISAHWVH